MQYVGSGTNRSASVKPRAVHAGPMSVVRVNW
ncbi:hypothetical protein Rrhod_4352 [Rhodococcus rhodnii LMG 5362]|uniref:Uncharacterized protein n=1 Tax=Rhodococcus rhodnii LMG 5362 TaxID=1273125 RepID=R7WK47_9NOCA|nr:hypothetical protein Rrhod_4352 [Rhodococcus rhodnii LMG 5362]